MTDAEIVALWLSNRTPGTERTYRFESDIFFRSVRKPLRDITADDVVAYLDSFERRAAGGRASMLAVIKSLFSFAACHGHIPVSPLLYLRNPKPKPRNTSRVLTEDEVRQLIRAATNERDRLMLQLYYVAGLRRGELAALHVRDLLDDGPTSGSIRVLGKGNKWRIVAIPYDILLALRAHAGTDPHAPVFRSSFGRAISGSQAFRVVSKVAKRAGLPEGCSPVWLRHSHATHRLDHGHDIRALRADMGHASFQGTEHYVHGRATLSDYLAA